MLGFVDDEGTGSEFATAGISESNIVRESPADETETVSRRVALPFCLPVPRMVRGSGRVYAMVSAKREPATG